MKPEEIVEYLGYDPKEINSLDALKNKFDSDFIKVANIHKDIEPVKKIIGATLGWMDVEMIRIAKAHGLEKDEYLVSKENKVTDKLKYILEKKEESFIAIENDYKEKLGKNSDETVKSLEKKLEKEAKKNQELSSLLETTKGTLAQKEESFIKEIKSTKKDIKKKDLLSQIDWNEGADELKKVGFLAKIEQTYDFDLDDSEEFFVYDKKTKEKIKSSKNAGSYKTPFEVLQEEGIKLGVWKQNKDSGKQVITKKVIEQTQPEAKGRKLSSLVTGG